MSSLPRCLFSWVARFLSLRHLSACGHRQCCWIGRFLWDTGHCRGVCRWLRVSGVCTRLALINTESCPPDARDRQAEMARCQPDSLTGHSHAVAVSAFRERTCLVLVVNGHGRDTRLTSPSLDWAVTIGVDIPHWQYPQNKTARGSRRLLSSILGRGVFAVGIRFWSGVAAAITTVRACARPAYGYIRSLCGACECSKHHYLGRQVGDQDSHGTSAEGRHV